MFVDMHVHTTVSDGTYSPEEIVELALEKQIEFLSITDHDTIDGVKNVNVRNLKFVPGVEISAEFPGTLHILGYNVDPDNEQLNRVLRQLQQYRSKRNELMVEKMNKYGFDITMDELREIAGEDLIGRPHFAQLFLKKGYVTSYQEAFDKYLKKGALFYIDKKRLNPDKAIELIVQAGGVAVLAHPYQTHLDDEELENLLKKLISYGLRGIEVYYSEHSQKQIEQYKNLAKRFDLLITAGSDFHGNNKDIQLGMEVPLEDINPFFEEVGI
ncbi:PHP domain-containing protein [Thermosipho ferrireducens]|uniref:PHP domain-containing protein n=1 Tax=Thermosipho ferrireducens TaxID=2571116 RepID=A0ABX7S754_9BACT|nr:PHP domain-containing protein [Thermosipho ferrireducens]QTA38427.1 PHP domain-containing protein [Thermosipho ferrireducens]